MAALLPFVIQDLRHSGRALLVFCACLLLGVTLVAASGALFQQVRDALLDDTRSLFGGDLEVRDRQALSDDTLAWMSARGEVSLLVELRSMLSTEQGLLQMAELQSVDEHYPLYGEVQLAPDMRLDAAVAQGDGVWGAAFDPVLAERLAVGVGDRLSLGDIEVELRASVLRQPDRSLRAAWRGPPLLISREALQASGLVLPGSRLGYRYRVRTDAPAPQWRDALLAAFPDADWEVRIYSSRGNRISEVLDQLASGLLLIGFSALFIGGLGVFNSVHAYLQAKLGTLATLRALGLRDARLATLYLLQVLLLAAVASAVGAALGAGLALLGTGLMADSLPLVPALRGMAPPLLVAFCFGLLTALTFALPALGRALSVSPAALFRGLDGVETRTPRAYWLATGACAVLLVALLLVALPDLYFGLGFVATVLGLLLVLEGVVRGLRHLAPRIAARPVMAGRFTLHLALASLYRPGSALRPMLLSLGSALTLLVASALVVAALLRVIDQTVPQSAPGLVLYDIGSDQVEQVQAALQAQPSLARLDIAPLVLGRIGAVNGAALRDSGDARRVAEARDEHKLTYRSGNVDEVVIERGAWWPPRYSGPPQVAMEDREADQLGLQIGDRLRFDILGEQIEAELVAIYAQRRFQSRFWFEAMFSDGALAPFVTRYVGAAFLGAPDANAARAVLARDAPNIVTVATQGILDEARALLTRAASGLGLVAAVSLLASLLVLAGVIASNRARQVHEAVLLHTLGARLQVIRSALRLEYVLVAILASTVAVALGVAIAAALLHYRIGLPAEGGWWLGALVALGVSTAALAAGAHFLMRELRVSPARMLKAEG